MGVIYRHEYATREHHAHTHRFTGPSISSSIFQRNNEDVDDGGTNREVIKRQARWHGDE